MGLFLAGCCSHFHIFSVKYFLPFFLPLSSHMIVPTDIKILVPIPFRARCLWVSDVCCKVYGSRNKYFYVNHIRPYLLVFSFHFIQHFFGVRTFFFLFLKSIDSRFCCCWSRGKMMHVSWHEEHRNLLPSNQ